MLLCTQTLFHRYASIRCDPRATGFGRVPQSSQSCASHLEVCGSFSRRGAAVGAPWDLLVAGTSRYGVVYVCRGFCDAQVRGLLLSS